jgi:protein-tyrosine phosphatase
MYKNPQNIDFKSVLNFRDVGGISTSGNRKIKEGLLFRSANPDSISRIDISKLYSLNIKTIIDLRAPHEPSKRAVSIDKSEKLFIPLDFQQTTRERLKPVIYGKDNQPVIADISNALYLEILDASAPAVRQVMEILASPGRTPVLIHCQAGKDRTGIIIACVLLAMGVNRSLIINDFMKSNEALLPHFKKMFRIRKILSLGFFPYKNMLFAVSVKQRNIESVLDRIDNHYGGIESYLTSAGFDISGMEVVKKLLISE